MQSYPEAKDFLFCVVDLSDQNSQNIKDKDQEIIERIFGARVPGVVIPVYENNEAALGIDDYTSHSSSNLQIPLIKVNKRGPKNVTTINPRELIFENKTIILALERAQNVFTDSFKYEDYVSGSRVRRIEELLRNSTYEILLDPETLIYCNREIVHQEGIVVIIKSNVVKETYTINYQLVSYLTSLYDFYRWNFFIFDPVEVKNMNRFQNALRNRYNGSDFKCLELSSGPIQFVNNVLYFLLVVKNKYYCESNFTKGDVIDQVNIGHENKNLFRASFRQCSITNNQLVDQFQLTDEHKDILEKRCKEGNAMFVNTNDASNLDNLDKIIKKHTFDIEAQIKIYAAAEKSKVTKLTKKRQIAT